MSPAVDARMLIIALWVLAVVVVLYRARAIENRLNAVHGELARLRERLSKEKKGHVFDKTLEMLLAEQGEWFVDKVLSHELGKVLRHNTRDMNTDSSDDESGPGGESESGDESDPELDTGDEVPAVMDTLLEHDNNSEIRKRT
jgi:hypothetical protein